MQLVKNRVLPLVLVALPVLTAMAGSRHRLLPQPHLAQRPAAPAGLWKGTSVCLRGKPVCKDEVVVYHIAPVPSAPAHFAIVANKLISGREEEMGALDCLYDRARASLECPMPAGMKPGTWRFLVRGRTLDGQLLVPGGGGPFRNVHVVRMD